MPCVDPVVINLLADHPQKPPAGAGRSLSTVGRLSPIGHDSAPSAVHDRLAREPTSRRRRAVAVAILELAIGFIVLAVIAAVLGAGGVAGLSMDIAKWLVLAFVVLALLSLVL
jgi:uncharacterized membrane protein YtjA (UPF0391 family)